MADLFGRLGEGKTVQRIAAGALLLGVAGTALGLQAERLAQSSPATIVTFLFGRPRAVALPAPRFNAIDFATTGSRQTDGRREVLVLGPCGDPAERR